MNCAIGTFDGRVTAALPEGRFPVDTGTPPVLHPDRADKRHYVD